MVGSAAIKQGRSANRKHTYFFFWPNIILAVLQFNALLKFFFILIGATLKGKDMLPKSSPF